MNRLTEATIFGRFKSAQVIQQGDELSFSSHIVMPL